MTNDKYTEGFNAGYLISKHSDKINQVLDQAPEGDEFGAGVNDGNKEYLNEQELERLSSLKKLKNGDELGKEL